MSSLHREIINGISDTIITEGKKKISKLHTIREELKNTLTGLI